MNGTQANSNAYTVQTVKAAPPFDTSQDADIILRTCDGQSFFVSKVILSLSSSVFRDMFSVPQPTSSITQQSQSQPLPVIEISDHSFPLDCLLRLCYPVADPALFLAQDLDICYRMAHKYEMSHCKDIIEQKLHSFPLYSHELPSYFAVACRWELERAAQSLSSWMVPYRKYDAPGAKEAIPHPPWDFDEPHIGVKTLYREVMRDIPAGAFQRLLHFLRRTAISGWIDDQPAMVSDAHRQLRAPESLVSLSFRAPARKGAPDLVLRTFDDVQFPAHSRIISSASTLLDLAFVRSPNGISTAKPPVVDVAIDSTSLAPLLHICYYISSEGSDSHYLPPSLSGLSLRQAERVYLQAVRHKVVRGREFMVARLKVDLFIHPLRVFLIAARLGLGEVASEAAVQVVHTNSAQTYDRELEDTEARHYFALLEFQERYLQTIVDLVHLEAEKRHLDGAALVKTAQARWSEVCERMAGSAAGEVAQGPDAALEYVLSLAEPATKEKKSKKSSKVIAARRETKKTVRPTRKSSRTVMPPPGKASLALAKVDSSFYSAFGDQLIASPSDQLLTRIMQDHHRPQALYLCTFVAVV
ncbi:hypothetical protein EIP91_003425 [Steccherinum ochraceum]|uniref:BTB domain-containing protein n=1 Tax=Steccherinum ochraceum TaxID=92696 RepID=A0A4R0RM70_9APHY|nr:hypothetical protein EIP91_003425 [Steccherinum ochraceum]